MFVQIKIKIILSHFFPEHQDRSIQLRAARDDERNWEGVSLEQRPLTGSLWTSLRELLMTLASCVCDASIVYVGMKACSRLVPLNMIQLPFPLLWETGTILSMGSANERRRYNVTSSLIGWAHTQKDPCESWKLPVTVNRDSSWCQLCIHCYHCMRPYDNLRCRHWQSWHHDKSPLSL